MRSVVVLPLLAVALVSLSGCGRSGLFNRPSPDEMAVTRKAPLVIPPDFSLQAPQAGTADAQTGMLQRQALEAMFGGPAPRSAGETSLLNAAGRNGAVAGIRSMVGDPETKVRDKGETTAAIIAAPEGDGQDARASAGS